MRRILIVLCFLCIAFVANSQTLGSSDNTWNEGYYYDLNGNKISGLIDRNHESGKSPVKGEDYFRFRKDKKSDKISLSTSMVKYFVSIPDSFVVSHANPKGTVFFKVLTDDSIKLYEYDKVESNAPVMMNGAMMGGGQSTVVKLFYGPDPDHVKDLKRKNFKEAMTLILAKRPELFAKIISKEYEYDDLESIINYYNGMKLEAARKKE